MVLLDELRGVLKALDEASVDYALIGALAVAVWGAPRATKDIDLLVRADDLERARAAARGAGFTLEALPLEFKDGATVQRVSKIDPSGNLMTLDLMLGDPNLEVVWQSRVRLPFGDQHVWVVSRETLTGMSAPAARPRRPGAKLDLSAAGVAFRLREASDLSEACSVLRQAGVRWEHSVR